MTHLNADGKPDILWQHTTGVLYVWYMNGVVQTSGSYLTPKAAGSGWKIAGGSCVLANVATSGSSCMKESYVDSKLAYEEGSDTIWLPEPPEGENYVRQQQENTSNYDPVTGLKANTVVSPKGGEAIQETTDPHLQQTSGCNTGIVSAIVTFLILPLLVLRRK